MVMKIVIYLDPYCMIKIMLTRQKLSGQDIVMKS